MALSTLKEYLLAKPFSEETYPFGENPMVLKVVNKMFALVGIENNPLTISLKANPQDAQIQRSMYDAIIPGYHLNKEHWNTVTLDGSISNDIVFQMVDESYDLVVQSLKNNDKEKVLNSISGGS